MTGGNVTTPESPVPAMRRDVLLLRVDPRWSVCSYETGDFEYRTDLDHAVGRMLAYVEDELSELPISAEWLDAIGLERWAHGVNCWYRDRGEHCRLKVEIWPEASALSVNGGLIKYNPSRGDVRTQCRLLGMALRPESVLGKKP